VRKASTNGLNARPQGDQMLVYRTGTALAETYVSRPHLHYREERSSDGYHIPLKNSNLKKGNNYSSRKEEIRLDGANLWQTNSKSSHMLYY